ncbi:MAG: ATP-grasp domain-containing protein [Candidatus Anammoxibacter sp.]
MEMISKRRILIIGAGHEQVRAYQAAKDIGLYVVGTDINPNALALQYADDNLICSTRDVEGSLHKVLDYAKRHKIDGVMTIANDVPLTVAMIASRLELESISIESAKLLANKLLMKECFLNNNVTTPAFHKVQTKDELVEKANRMKLPLVLKPSDGRGSRGVLFLDETVDLDWAWENSLKYSDNKILLLEEFISGPQLSVEGVFINGKYIPVAFADRNYDNLRQTKPFIVENGGVIPTRFDENVTREIGELIEKAAFSLGINWGTVKADIVLNNKIPQIIELAGRLSGNYLATHHIPMAYGIDIVSTLINLSLGNDVAISKLIPQKKCYLGVRYFFPKAGKIKAIEGVDSVGALHYVKMLEFYRKVGDNQTVINSHASRAGTIICTASDYLTAQTRVEEAVKKINFVVS